MRAPAAGFDLPDQDAFAVGRGMAVVATADNPSAVYYNPAGITQLQGNNFRAGIYGIYLDPSYQPNPPRNGTFHNQNPLHAIPQFFYTYGPEELPLSFGLGVFSPFGLSVSWPQDTGFRTLATQGELTSYAFNPVVAWKVTTNLSLAAGVSAIYANADLQQGLVWPMQPNDRFRFTGGGWDVGYNLGLLWHPHEKLALGISFRSTPAIDLDGHTDTSYLAGALPGVPSFATSSDAKAAFPFPIKAIFGISYRPTPQWNFEFDADYTDWNQVGTVTVRQASPSLLVSQVVPITLKWESSWYYEFGATRYLGNGWLVSAGYIFNENSVPDAHYTPLVADLDRHFLSLGTGFRGQMFDFDVAYQFGYGPTRQVDGSMPSLSGQTADGRYEFISHAIALSVGMHF